MTRTFHVEFDFRFNGGPMEIRSSLIVNAPDEETAKNKLTMLFRMSYPERTLIRTRRAMELFDVGR